MKLSVLLPELNENQLRQLKRLILEEVIGGDEKESLEYDEFLNDDIASKNVLKEKQPKALTKLLGGE